LDTNEIVKKLLEAKEVYYNKVPIMTDQQFDDLEDQLRELDPNNNYFKIVGTTEVKNKKIKHNIPMLSCQKAKTIEEVQKWLNKILDHKEELIIEPKIDGLSCTIFYKNGHIDYISTRGDGKIGQDISHISKYIDIPNTIDILRDIEIRGELYLPKDTKFPNSNNKPLRNLAVGLINRKDNREDLKYIKFIAYQIINSSNHKESEDISQLKDWWFESIASKMVYSIEDIEYYFKKYKDSFRGFWNFETDGLVLIVNNKDLHLSIDSKWIVEHHHHWNIALKPESESQSTILLDIEWNVSRNGNIIPVAKIQPINIGGSIIKRVTLNNYKNVKSLNLGWNDLIEISRSNDVIPFFQRVINHISPDKIDISICPSCNSKLIYEGVHIRCPNSNCEEQKIQKIIYWVQQCEMENLSGETVRTLFNYGVIQYIQDLYCIDRKYLEGIPGIGQIKADNIIKQIEKSKTMTVIQFINRLGIILVGEKAVKKMGIKTIQDLWDFKDDTSVVGQNLIAYTVQHKQFIEDLLQYLNIIEEKGDNNMDKIKICMTGTGPKGRKELIKDIESKGYIFVDSITKETNILLCEDKNSGSSKLEKAKKLGIKIIEYKEFF